MLAKLKNVKVLLTILLILTWIIAIAGGAILYITKNKAIDNKQAEVTKLQNTLNQIGELVPAYTLNAGVKMGQEIQSSDYTETQVPSTMAKSLIQDPSELNGKHYRMDLTAGTALTKDNIKSEELTDDMRLYDIVLDTSPVGLKVGAYVDVRITLPLGEDFVAMSHKRVEDINGGVMKLAVNEHDIHAYNSMLIDKLMYPGTQLYALEYVEGGVQKASDVYYPMSKKVITIAQKDPNLISAIKSDILQKRNNLEKGMSSIKATAGADQKEVDTILENGREKYREAYTEASRDFDLKVERAADKKAEEAAQSQQ